MTLYKTISLTALAITSVILLIAPCLYPKPKNELSFTSFISYTTKHNKIYANLADMAYRYKIYTDNLRTISEHNKQSSSYRMDANDFSDLTFHEFRGKHLTAFKLSYSSNEVSSGRKPTKGSVDWRSKGIVSRVKFQADCSAGWAFAATSAIESYYALHRTQSIELSEQELIDCSMRYGTGGCNGGLPHQALNYVIDHDINLESDYTYLGYDSYCNSDLDKPRYTINGYRKLDPADVSTLIDEITNQPVVVSIAVEESFMHYSSGVYTSDRCDGNIGHSMLAVGYNTDVDVGYFILKNSFGESWGEAGYVRFEIGTGAGTCRIANEYDLIIF